MGTNPDPHGPRSRTRLETVALLSIIAVCAALFVRLVGPDRPDPPIDGPAPIRRGGNPPPPPPTLPPPAGPISIVGAAVAGSPKAPIALVVFSDFQCPYCARFARDTWPSIEKAYVTPGRLLVAFRHLPIESIHPRAIRAAEAAACADRQQRFWPMHDRLFQSPQDFSDDGLRAAARTLGLRDSIFDACMSGETLKDVRADMKTAAELGVTGTPTFFLGTMLTDRRVKVTLRSAGARPYEQFSMAFDNLLKVPAPAAIGAK